MSLRPFAPGTHTPHTTHPGPYPDMHPRGVYSHGDLAIRDSNPNSHTRSSSAHSGKPCPPLCLCCNIKKAIAAARSLVWILILHKEACFHSQAWCVHVRVVVCATLGIQVIGLYDRQSSSPPPHLQCTRGRIPRTKWWVLLPRCYPTCLGTATGTSKESTMDRC